MNPGVRVTEDTADATQLPDGCCDAVYLRTVFHHIEDKPAFANVLAKAVRAGGRVGIIDFPPEGLWFHGADHGVPSAIVIDALSRAGLGLVEHLEGWGGGTYRLVFDRP